MMPLQIFNRCVLSICTITCVVALSGCHPLTPKTIQAQRYYVAPELMRENDPQIERGQPRPIIDAVGTIIGIPSKIILWNRRIENHSISAETQADLETYLMHNGLEHVKVRLNQYRPLEDWRRLTRNKTVAAPWRYTFGAVVTAGETIVPGRIFGGDHFNPYTNTLHIYSDVSAVALHEAAHAKDFSRRKYQGSYAAVYALPFAPLYHESIATSDVLAYLEILEDPVKQEEAYRTLFPAYGTYIGNSAGTIFPRYSNPLFMAAVISGHIDGRMRAKRIVGP